MRNNTVEWEDSYDYSPNELYELSKNNPKLYREVVESNLEEEDSVEKWEIRNRERQEEDLRRHYNRYGQ